MNPTKPSTAGAKPAKATETTQTTASAVSSSRKPWIKKSSIEVFLGAVGRQEQKVAELRQQLAREERELQKLEQARKVLES